MHVLGACVWQARDDVRVVLSLLNGWGVGTQELEHTDLGSCLCPHVFICACLCCTVVQMRGSACIWACAGASGGLKNPRMVLRDAPGSSELEGCLHV